MHYAVVCYTNISGISYARFPASRLTLHNANLALAFYVSGGLFCSVMHNRVQKPQHHVAPGVDLCSNRGLNNEVKSG